jgi:hypothetical protein
MDADKITFRCGVCRSPGHIQSVMVSLTVLILEGHCPACSHTSHEIVDLLQVDDWLRGNTDRPMGSR